MKKIKERLPLTLNIQHFAQTKAADLVNPEVMQAALGGKLENAIKFRQYADIDRDLVGQPGDTITRPKYAYIGPADELEEGVPMDTSKLSMTTTTVTVKETGKAVEMTETAIITNLNGTVGEAERQLALSMADRVDMDYIAELNKAVQSVEGSPTTPSKILEAITVFNAESDLNLVLFINPKDYNTLVGNLLNVGGSVQERAMTTATVSDLLGIKAIERTRRVEEGKGYLQVFNMSEEGDSEEQSSSMEIVLKKDVAVGKDNDILARTVTVATNAHYTVNLKNDTGVVKFSGE